MLVANWTCSYVLKDMLAIHQKGTRTTRTKARSPTRVRALAEGFMPPVSPSPAGGSG